MVDTTAAVVSASPNHLSFLITGNSDPALITIANSVILAAMPPGPLRDAWNTTYTDKTAMRVALLGGGPAKITANAGIPGTAGTGYCEAALQGVTALADVTATLVDTTVDVDTDAVSVTKAELNIGASDSVGTTLTYLHLRHRFSTHR